MKFPPVEEQIGHDSPRLIAGKLSLQVQDLTSQEPVQETNGVLASIVGGDGNVHVLQRRISVGESNCGNVDIRGFSKGLSINAGVGDNEKTGLLEVPLLLLIGKCTRGEPIRATLF